MKVEIDTTGQGTSQIRTGDCQGFMAMVAIWGLKVPTEAQLAHLRTHARYIKSDGTEPDPGLIAFVHLDMRYKYHGTEISIDPPGQGYNDLDQGHDPDEPFDLELLRLDNEWYLTEHWLPTLTDMGIDPYDPNPIPYLQCRNPDLTTAECRELLVSRLKRSRQ